MKIILAVAVALCSCVPAFPGEGSDPIEPYEIKPLLNKAALIDNALIESRKDESINVCESCAAYKEGQQQLCLKDCVSLRYGAIFGIKRYSTESSEKEIRNGIALIVEELEAQKAVLADYRAFIDRFRFDASKKCYSWAAREEIIKRLGSEPMRLETIGCDKFSADNNIAPSKCMRKSLDGIKSRFKTEVESLNEECNIFLEATKNTEKQQERTDAQSQRIKDNLSKTGWSAGKEDLIKPMGDTVGGTMNSMPRINSDSKPDVEIAGQKDKDYSVPEKYKTLKKSAVPALGEEKSGGPADGEHHFDATVTQSNKKPLSDEAQGLVREVKTLATTPQQKSVLSVFISRCEGGDTMCEVLLQGLVNKLRSTK